MSDETILESERIRGRFEELSRQPIIKFSRGCRNVPNEDGVYVIYGRWEGEVFYVGRTIQAVRRSRSPMVIGLRQRLRQHRAKYGRTIGTRYSIGFRFLVVPDPRQRALLEALATGILCPIDLAYGYKRLSDIDPDDRVRLDQVLHDIRNMEQVEWSWIANDQSTDVKDDLSNLTEAGACILLWAKNKDGSRGMPIAVSPALVIEFRPAVAIEMAIEKGISQLDALLDSAKEAAVESLP
jgi:hypothetical protein